MTDVFQDIRERASARSKRIVFVHWGDVRVLTAAVEIEKKRLAHPLFVGDPGRIVEYGRGKRVDVSRIEVSRPDPARVAWYASRSFPEWRAQGLGEVEARQRLRDPKEFSAAMVRAGEADGMLTGPEPADGGGSTGMLSSLGSRSRPFRYFVAEVPTRGPAKQCFLFAYPLVQTDPTAVELAESALGIGRQRRGLASEEPRLAFLSLGITATLEGGPRFTTAAQELEKRVQRAIATVRAREPSLEVSPQLWHKIPVSALSTREQGSGADPNTFAFVSGRGPTLYEMTKVLPEGSRVIGPLVGGLDRPMNTLGYSCGIDDVVDITAITCLVS